MFEIGAAAALGSTPSRQLAFPRRAAALDAVARRSGDAEREIIGVVPNRLAAEPSPYLLQHKDNPVEWYPWGEDAFTRAKREDKPIFLSIGYSACHWCHVMEHESFENLDVADVLNRDFVSMQR